MFKDALYLSLILSRPITGSVDLLGYPMIVYESISVMDECNLSPDLRLITQCYDKQVDALFQLTSTTRKFPRKWAALKEKKLTRYSAITCAECIRTVTTAVVSDARRAFPYIFFRFFPTCRIDTVATPSADDHAHRLSHPHHRPPCGASPQQRHVAHYSLVVFGLRKKLNKQSRCLTTLK